MGWLYLNWCLDSSFFFYSLWNISPGHFLLPSSPLKIWNGINSGNLDTYSYWHNPRRVNWTHERGHVLWNIMRSLLSLAKAKDVQQMEAYAAWKSSYCTRPHVTSPYGDPWSVSIGLHLTVVKKEDATISSFSQGYSTPPRKSLSSTSTISRLPWQASLVWEEFVFERTTSTSEARDQPPLTLPPLQHHSKNDVFLANRRKEGDMIQGWNCGSTELCRY